MCFTLCAFSQLKYAENINKYNSLGQKEGFWVDSTYRDITQCYYRNGLRSGVYKRFNSVGDLTIFGEYENGQMCGTWFYFNYGYLWSIYKNFETNTDTIFNDLNEAFIPDHKCYSIGYHLNGKIQEEGTILWYEGDEPESDMHIRYGEWKYYNEEGNLIKTEKIDKTFWTNPPKKP